MASENESFRRPFSFIPSFDGIPVYDRLFGSPISLYRKYNVFPTRLVLSLLLAIIAAYHGTQFNSFFGVITRMLGQDFQSIFFPSDYGQYNGDNTDSPSNTRYFIFTLDQLNSSLFSVAMNYNTLSSTTLTPSYLYIPSSSTRFNNNSNLSMLSPSITALRYSSPASELFDPTSSFDFYTSVISTIAETYPFPTTDDLSLRGLLPYPFLNTSSSVSDVRNRLYTTSSIQITCPVFISNPSDLNSQIFLYESIFVYDFSNRNHIEVLWSLNLAKTYANDEDTMHITTLSLLLFIFTLLLIVVQEGLVLYQSSIILTKFVYKTVIQSLYSSASSFSKSSYSLDNNERSTSNLMQSSSQLLPVQTNLNDVGEYNDSVSIQMVPLSSSGKKKVDESEKTNNDDDEQSETEYSEPLTVFSLVLFIDPLTLVSSLGAYALGFYTCILWTHQGDYASVQRYSQLLSLAVIGCFINTFHYFSTSIRFYTNVLTIYNAAPNILRFILGMAPIYIAFGLFGLVFFGNTGHVIRFSSPTLAFSTIFSFFNGDALVETFEHTERSGIFANNTFFTMVADVYLCSLLLFFTYVGTNCIVGIVEESFFNIYSSKKSENPVELSRRKLSSMYEKILD
jgi:hypothetical protein